MERRIGTPAVLGTAVWRAAIATSAFTGWWIYGHDLADLRFLTQSSNLLAAIGYAVVAAYGLVVGLARHREPATQLPRGAMTLLLLIVGGSYLGLMGGDVSRTQDLLTHVVTPLLALTDWCFVGRSQTRTRWWEVLLWLVPPLVWIGWYTASDGFADAFGYAIYDFLDPADNSYWGTVAGLLVGAVALGFVLFGIARLRGSLSAPPTARPKPVGAPAPAGQQWAPPIGPPASPQAAPPARSQRAVTPADEATRIRPRPHDGDVP